MSPTASRAILLISLVALAGCANFGKQTPPAACPSVALLGDAADVTRYKGTGRDVPELLVDGRITSVPAQCRYGDNGSVYADLAVRATIARGPTTNLPDISVPIVISVLDGDAVLDQQDFAITASFPSNVDSVPATSNVIRLRLPNTAQKSAAAYKIFVGFRLTPGELALNRARGPR
jgi:hypothetical protein